jgi:hypothetical protein
MATIGRWLRPGWLLATTGHRAWTAIEDHWLGGEAPMLVDPRRRGELPRPDRSGRHVRRRPGGHLRGWRCARLFWARRLFGRPDETRTAEAHRRRLAGAVAAIRDDRGDVPDRWPALPCERRLLARWGCGGGSDSHRSADRQAGTGTRRPTAFSSGSAALPWGTCPRRACARNRPAQRWHGGSARSPSCTGRGCACGRRPVTAGDARPGPLEASSGAVPVWVAKWCLLGNRRMSPTSPRNLAASTGPTPKSWTRLVLDWATSVLMRASTAAIRWSSWPTSAIRSATGASGWSPAHQRT